MSYTYTLKSKCLNALNDVIKKITITENAKVIKNPLLEADNNFTSIVQSDNQFDPSKINSNVLADKEEVNATDEKKLEKKNKLKTMILNKIKQSLEISDDLQAMLKEIDNINKDTNLNEWVLNEKGNTAELKAKNANIFKQNNQLCLSHDGKIEIFHSVQELHDWLKKNNYPLPKNIKLHESVNLKEASELEELLNKLKNGQKLKISNNKDSDIYKTYADNNISNEYTAYDWLKEPHNLQEIVDFIEPFYGPGLAKLLALRMYHGTDKPINSFDARVQNGYSNEEKDIRSEEERNNRINLIDLTKKISQNSKDIDYITRVTSLLKTLETNGNNKTPTNAKINIENILDTIFEKFNLNYDLSVPDLEKKSNFKFSSKDIKILKTIQEDLANISKELKDENKKLNDEFAEIHNNRNSAEQDFKSKNNTEELSPGISKGKYSNLDVTLELPDEDWYVNHDNRDSNGEIKLTKPEDVAEKPRNVGAKYFGKDDTWQQYINNRDMGKAPKKVDTWDIPDFSPIKFSKESVEVNEDCTTVSNLGSPVQYLGNKKLEETDELEEQAFKALDPDNAEKYVWYAGVDPETGDLIYVPEGDNEENDKKALSIANKKAADKGIKGLNDGHKIANYWINIFNDLNKPNLSDAQRNLLIRLRNSNMFDKNKKDSFINKLIYGSGKNWSQDIVSSTHSITSKTLNHSKTPTGQKLGKLFTILPDVRYDLATDKQIKKDINDRIIKTPEELKNRITELRDYLGKRYGDKLETMPYTLENIIQWFSVPEFLRNLHQEYLNPEKEKFILGTPEEMKLFKEIQSYPNLKDEWFNGTIYTYNNGKKYGMVQDLPTDEKGNIILPEDGYTVNTIRQNFDKKDLPYYAQFLTDFKEALIEAAFNTSKPYADLDKAYNELKSRFDSLGKPDKPIHDPYATVYGEDKSKEIFNKLLNAKGNINAITGIITSDLIPFLKDDKISKKTKIDFLNAMGHNGLGLDKSILQLIHQLLMSNDALKGTGIRKKERKENFENDYDFELLKQDLTNHVLNKNNTKYNLDLFKQDLANYQQPLTEDETPEDFKSGLNMNITGGNTSSDSSGASTDTISDQNIDMDTDSGLDSSGTDFGNINIGNFGDYGPEQNEDNPEMSQMPLSPEETEVIIDVLEDENNNIKVKTKNEGTDKISIKNLNEIDV